MKSPYFLLIALLFSLPSFGQKKISQQEVLEDLQFLRESLEEAHYNLYTYTTKEAFDQNFEKVKSSITKDSLSLRETASILQTVVSKVNNGHTEIPFPGAAYLEHGDSGGSLFPLELAFEGEKALIRRNLTGNDNLKIGAELISINGLGMKEVLEKIFPLISAERRYFKLAKLELFSFPRYYWWAFGEEKTFEVEIKHGGILKKYQLKAVDTFEGFEDQRKDIFAYERELRIFDQAAYLRTGHFGGDEKAYQQFMDSCFRKINNEKLPNLIIDLRNNLGGNEPFGNYLVSYLADQPFRWCAEFTLKTSAILKAHARANYDTTGAYGQSILTHEDGSIYPFEFDDYQPQPKDKRYRGKVYVLINRQSHSQSAVTAAQIQDYQLATIVGEETGDFSSLLASQYAFFLPRTGIEVKISKGHIVRVNGSKKAEGVIPDIYIQDHLLDEDDEILDALLEQIKKEP